MVREKSDYIAPAQAGRRKACAKRRNIYGRRVSARLPFVPATAGEPQDEKPCPDKKQKQVPHTIRILCGCGARLRGGLRSCSDEQSSPNKKYEQENGRNELH